MTLLLALVSSISISAREFNCNIKMNGEEVHNTSFKVSAGESIKFADSPSLKFYLKSMKDDKFELQAYDVEKASRTYAIGKVRESGDILNYTLWTRSALIESECLLK
ncbi:MAG: hypothetical protein CES88_00060 [Halobacteriovorax sp. JY17]|nr:MAG: hypothetical protein CES88_00060 [Halobacteriovorax sp. JY17]